MRSPSVNALKKIITESKKNLIFSSQNLFCEIVGGFRKGFVQQGYALAEMLGGFYVEVLAVRQNLTLQLVIHHQVHRHTTTLVA